MSCSSRGLRGLVSKERRAAAWAELVSHTQTTERHRRTNSRDTARRERFMATLQTGFTGYHLAGMLVCSKKLEAAHARRFCNHCRPFLTLRVLPRHTEQT